MVNQASAVAFDREFDKLKILEETAHKEGWTWRQIGQSSNGLHYTWEKEISCCDRMINFVTLFFKSCLIFPLFSRNFRDDWARVFSGKKVQQILLKNAPGTTPAPTSSARAAVLYMSITGNPTHLGHMAAVAAAINVLKASQIPVAKAYVSLSSQKYMESKILPGNGKFNKITLSLSRRQFFLEAAIKEATNRQMFDGVPVSYWDDQVGADPNSTIGIDHPEAYDKLSEEEDKADRDVYLVAGTDLCRRMNNWPTVKRAIIVQRTPTGTEQAVPEAPAGCKRMFIQALYPEFAGLSSSAIREGRAKLEPDSVQMNFELSTNP